MKKWASYKKTYRTESDIFDFARVGDLRGLADILSQDQQIDLNAKNNRGYSALMLAVYSNQKDFCEALLRCGADVNSTDSIGNTLAMGAAFKGNLDILKLLLTFNADLTFVNQTKMNVRDWAVMFKRPEIIAYLDTVYQTDVPTSKVRNIMRLVKLALIMCQTTLRKKFN